MELNFNPKKILEQAGYREFPPHCDKKNPPDQEFITQSKWNKNDFPRFHLTRRGKIWSLHFDFFEGEETHSSENKSQVVKNECRRLKKLSLESQFRARLKKM